MSEPLAVLKSGQETEKKVIAIPNAFKKNLLNLLLWITVIGSSFYLSSQNYMLFHSIIETWVIIVGMIIALIVLNSYKNLASSFIPIIGVSYAFTSVFEFLHSISNMYFHIFASASYNLELQLSMFPKYFISSGMLFAGISFYRDLPLNYLLGLYGAVTITGLLSVFYWGNFPLCYSEETGMTAFKIYGEYVILLTLVGALYLLVRNKERFSAKVYGYLLAFFAATVCSEFLLAIYSQMRDPLVAISHVLKGISLYFLYRAVVETSLQNPYQRLHETLQRITDCFCSVDRELRFTYMNESAKILFGNRDLLGRNIWEIPYVGKMYEEKIRAVIDNKEVAHFETCVERIGRWFEVSIYPSEEGISAYFRDITDRKMVEQHKKEQHDLLRAQISLLNLEPEFALMTNMEGVILFWSERAEAGYGWTSTQAMGQVSQQLLNSSFPKPLSEIKEELLHNGRWEGEIEHTRADGSIITVRSCWLLRKGVAEKEDAIIQINRDITEEKRIKQQMQRLDQLNLVGQMAAGISHEIRNPMTTVRGYLQRVLMKKDFIQYHEVFQLMIDELDRANSIITEFLSMAREKRTERAFFSLNSIIKQLQPLIEADALGSGKTIVFALTNAPVLQLDGKEIRQLILNLSRNALEATPQGKTVTIGTYYLEEEKQTVLYIRDEGSGIDKSIIDKIGTPFVTTKPNGTGLGLAICYSIAARHQAFMEFETGGKGTTFSIRFQS